MPVAIDGIHVAPGLCEGLSSGVMSGNAGYHQGCVSMGVHRVKIGSTALECCFYHRHVTIACRTHERRGGKPTTALALFHGPRATAGSLLQLRDAAAQQPSPMGQQKYCNQSYIELCTCW